MWHRGNRGANELTWSRRRLKEALRCSTRAGPWITPYMERTGEIKTFLMWKKYAEHTARSKVSEGYRGVATRQQCLQTFTWREKKNRRG